MSILLDLPAELIHHIGSHMLARPYHLVLGILSQSCPFLQAHIHDRLMQAKEIRLLHAWKTDWKNALKLLSADQMAILERHRNIHCLPFPPERNLLDTCVEVGNEDVMQYIVMARKLHDKSGDM